MWAAVVIEGVKGMDDAVNATNSSTECYCPPTGLLVFYGCASDPGLCAIDELAWVGSGCIAPLRREHAQLFKELLGEGL